MKGNVMVRMMTLVILVSLLMTHISGQIDLFAPNWLWLAAFAALMGLQATFTGWCPSTLMGKLSSTGKCCPEGSCSSQVKPAPQDRAKAVEASTGCCGTASATACCDSPASQSSEACCADKSDTKSANSVNASVGGCCGGGCGGDNVLEIKVLGTGCPNCANTVKLIENTAADANIKIKVIKVEDVGDIASYGVMSTPAVVIDDQVMHAGSIPSKQKILEWINGV